jgi:hypothetical protein
MTAISTEGVTVKHRLSIAGLFLASLILMIGCGDDPIVEDPPQSLTPQEVFRFETFGNETWWTDTLRMHEVVQAAVDPATALAVGFKVDMDAVPLEVLQAADLTDPATTVELIRRNAVVGLKGKIDAKGKLVQLGVTCALCHSSVDDALMPGIGHRMDGWANTDLNPGLIVSLSPYLQDPATQAVLTSWGPGMYDPRISIDGINDPVVIPPAYGLRDVASETYTGDGVVSYWNAYVAVTQMHGHGDFSDPRIGVSVDWATDQVTPLLAPLLEYQLSLIVPPPPQGSFDQAGASRGRVVFEDAGCVSCHSGPLLTDAAEGLHDPGETCMDPTLAQRAATRLYRTTPLRGLWQHAPYFHDGSAATLADVVEHYDACLVLDITAQQRNDLIEYLKSL